MNAAARLIATVLEIGRFPFAPGTVASAVALPFAWLILRAAGPYALCGAALLAAAIGVWASDMYVRDTGKSDPSECVIDEVAGQWFACAFAPLSLPGFVLAFVLFRLFDITKPWPASAAERLNGGLGVVADDMVAGLFAGLIVSAAWTLGAI
jgi:phosphatidylglycerophosphatase A